MAIKKDADGRRWVAVEVELPGTPEQVWQAVATGPGITSWFCPADVEERAGGNMVFHMGPGMDSTASITAWDPPRRLAAESPGWAPGMPAIATEWTVEARAGGTCLVRVVHSMFASSDDWDNQLEGTETGWPGFFLNLRLYLTHFRGQHCSPIRVLACPAGSPAEAWQKLIAALGLAGSAAGQKKSASTATPPFRGIVEHFKEDKGMYDMLIRLEEPAPGLLSIGSFDCGMTMAGLYFYLYGDAAAAVAERDAPRWQEWLSRQFPQPQAEAGAAGNA